MITLWRKNDIVTFLVDLGNYHPVYCSYLNSEEKEQLLHLLSEISKKRFVLSRVFLKQILSGIFSLENITDIVLLRNERGRVLVRDYPNIWISLSYSGTEITITLGKEKVGSDIEVIRPLFSKKIADCPLFKDFPFGTETEFRHNLLQAWTMVESYAKFADKNPYQLLNTSSFFFSEVKFVSYCVDKRSIFTTATYKDQGKEDLVWPDFPVP